MIPVESITGIRVTEGIKENDREGEFTYEICDVC
jgi:hypothetical protein